MLHGKNEPLANTPSIVQKRLTSWREISDEADALGRNWLFRGHGHADWQLQTSLEREFGSRGADVEQALYWEFVRKAPQRLPSHLRPHDDHDAAAWLGLIQHYGGPTRLLDMTRSPFVALFFAFEPTGTQDRALWAVERHWCTAACARIMAEGEGRPLEEMVARTTGGQAYLVYSLVHRRRHPDPLFQSFVPFRGVFPVDPWKPDARQSAQQAMFLCAADPQAGFLENLITHRSANMTVLCRFALPAALRDEVLDRLLTMNVTAATLFPDLTGLARSLRTLTIGCDANSAT